MNRQACIIAAGEWDGHRALLKVRDRNYTPQLTLVHEIRAGVEMAYVRDEVTGWCEGLNARGLGVVNAALAVGVDEAEVKLVKTLGKKSRDGERIVKALEQRSLDEALAVLRTYKGGLKGHTFVSTPQRTVSLEQLSEEKAHPAPVDADEDGDYAVRTNHGIHYADVGYTEGTGYVSSVVRKERATTALAAVADPFGLAPALMAARDENRGDPNNMVRDTARMSTTSQLVLDLTARELHLFLIPGKCSYEGARVELPAGRRPAIKTRVYTYREGGTALVELDPKTGAEVGAPRPVRPSAERVARRFSQTP